MTTLSPPTVSTVDNRFSLLDLGDEAAVGVYEASLYRQFAPLLPHNPLIRDLWTWDHTRRRLRTRVPYASQQVALLCDPVSGEILFSMAINLDPMAQWQSGTYGFACPPHEEHACEILVVAGLHRPNLHGLFIIRRFIHGFIFRRLAQHGYAWAYATSADAVRAVYRRAGAQLLAERTLQGHRRTLMRWNVRQP
ncbi:MAG: hypothetical protein AAGI71_14180 [Bacteroidota bacterium]